MSRIDVPTPDGLMPAYHRRAAQGAPDRQAIVLIHEGFGLNRHIESIADRLAAAGHPVIAPHLFYRMSRESASYDDVPRALELCRRAEPAQIVSDIDEAAAIVGRPGQPVVAIGFCFGGAAAYIAASLSSRVSRAVAFYPVSILTYWDHVGPPKVPLLVIFGDADEFLGPKERAWLAELDSDPVVRMNVQVYPGAGHAFFNDARPDLYAREAALASWRLAMDFLDET